MSSYIITNSGVKFDFSNIPSNPVVLEDIAWALSMTCRFGGHSKKFYSVAEHSCLVAERCKAYNLEGLMHDAAEAYIGDIVTPLKQYLTLDIEESVERLISKRFNLTYPWPAEVHEHDQVLLATEMVALFGKNHSTFEVDPRINIQCLSQKEAYNKFLETFDKFKVRKVKVDLGDFGKEKK